MKTPLLALGCLAFAARLLAQQPANTKPPLPPGPLIEKRAPEFAQWIIRSAGSADRGKASSPSPKSEEKHAAWGDIVVMTKTGQVMLRQTTDDSKQVWNTWVIGEQGLQTTISPDGKKWIVQARNPDPNTPTPNYEDYSKTDFPSFEWITESNYAGVQEVAGRRCLLFTDKVKLLSDDLEATPISAYIDLETRLPVAINQGGNARTYDFRSPPSAPLQLPTLVQGLIDNRQKTLESMTRKPVRRF